MAGGSIRRTKAQSLSEYAIVFALVGAALVAMQTYVKRAIQGGIANSANSILKLGPEFDIERDQYVPERDLMLGEISRSAAESYSLSNTKDTEFMAGNEKDEQYGVDSPAVNEEFATVLEIGPSDHSDLPDGAEPIGGEVTWTKSYAEATQPVE
ncbi:MAG: hypothetical protein PHR44_08120 [Candidatus Omnitrophica bacterium]|nr:hypothetical protein [Candidatus Omnitrophota bacterium]